MSSYYIYHIIHRRATRLIPVIMIGLTLIVGCTKAEPTVITIPISATPAPSATKTLQHTRVPTGMPTEAATSIPEPVTKPGVRIYGNGYNDYLFDILFLADGGTLLAGQANNTRLSDRISPGNAHLIRTDSSGDIIWERDYGGDDDALLYSLIQVGEDEYVALGQIAASYVRNETDMYLIKIDGEGNEIWSHTYGGRGMDHAKMVRQALDGGFILIGSMADEFATGLQYEADVFLVKTDAEGNEVWRRTFGDKILSTGWGVEPTPDGGYVFIGWEAKTYPDRDVIAIKINAMGDVEWSRAWDLDPGDRDAGYDLILTSDGHIVIACIKSMNSGPRGAVLIKVDLAGNEVWVKEFGEEEVGYEFWDIMEDTDGGYVMAGAILTGGFSYSGEDIRNGLVIKTDPDGEILWQYVFEMDEFEQQMFSSAVVQPEGGYVFVGRAIRTGERYADMLWLKLTPPGE
jgi:outer membrane protein assembly factor BamB